MEITRLPQDDNLKKEAKWKEYMDGEVLVARAGNRKFQRQVLRESRFAARSGRVNFDQQTLDKVDRNNQKSAAEFVLLDWKGFTEGGKEVKYSVKKALEYFQSYPSFYEDVMRLAQEVADQYGENMEVASKNSSNSSSGVSSSDPET